MTNRLQSVINNSTAKRVRYKYHLKTDIAGKTGTRQNHTDGWFIVYTSECLCGV